MAYRIKADEAAGEALWRIADGQPGGRPDEAPDDDSQPVPPGRERPPRRLPPDEPDRTPVEDPRPDEPPRLARRRPRAAAPGRRLEARSGAPASVSATERARS